MSRPSAAAALKKLATKRVGLEEGLEDLAGELFKASDRALAVLWCATVEDNLCKFILTKMRHLSPDDRDKMFGGYGPLSTFASKISVSYAFSFIGDTTRRNLNIMRDIRNAFAHTGAALSFNTKEVSDVCRLLVRLDGQPSDHSRKPRLVYQDACFELAGRMYNQVRGSDPSELP